jgi:hypothetical protein
LKAAIFRYSEELLVEFVGGEAIIRSDFENAEHGTRRAGDAGAAVTIRLGKVATGWRPMR